MKKLLFTSIVLLFSLSQISAQTYSLKYFMGGGGFNRFSLDNEPSDFDSLSYNIRTNDSDRYSFTVLTLGIENASGNFTEIGIGYTQGKSQVGDYFLLGEFLPKGNYFGRAIALDFERYVQYKKFQTEKLRTYWGAGFHSMYELGKIDPIESSNIYPNKKQRIGIGTRFLTRLIWGSQAQRWKLEGTFGFSLVDFFYTENYKDNPAFSELQKQSSIFDLDLPLEAFAQLGVSFRLNKSKNTEDK